MSRKREVQREKRKEMARQLGVATGEVEEHRALQENARVCRPVLRVLGRAPAGGLLGRLFSRAEPLVLALYLVDGQGAHLLYSGALEKGEVRLEKLTYHRPARFVLVACTVRQPGDVVAALPQASLHVDGMPLTAPALASEDWEHPRAVQLSGLAGATRGAVVCVRGIARACERAVLPLPPLAPTVEIEI